MEPLERLLNLVGLLLETRTPLTFEQIRDTLEPYRQEKVDSAKRMFERDKDILRDYGVPLQLVDTDAWGTEQGYVIPKDAYYLPEIAFTPEELAALFVAAQGVRNDTPAEEAVRKLMVGAEGSMLAGLAGGPLASGSDARGSLVMAVAAAAQDHRRVRFGYRTSKGTASDRDVDAYTALFRAGHWYLVGFDHERGEARSFRLSRFTTDLSDAGPGGEAARRVPRGGPDRGGSLDGGGGGARDDRAVAGRRMVGHRQLDGRRTRPDARRRLGRGHGAGRRRA